MRYQGKRSKKRSTVSSLQSKSKQRKAAGLPSPHAVALAMKQKESEFRFGNDRRVFDRSDPTRNDDPVFVACWFKNMTPTRRRRECARLSSQG